MKKQNPKVIALVLSLALLVIFIGWGMLAYWGLRNPLRAKTT
jgi:hypothetical protein